MKKIILSFFVALLMFGSVPIISFASAEQQISVGMLAQLLAALQGMVQKVSELQKSSEINNSVITPTPIVSDAKDLSCTAGQNIRCVGEYKCQGCSNGTCYGCPPTRPAGDQITPIIPITKTLNEVDEMNSSCCACLEQGLGGPAVWNVVATGACSTLRCSSPYVKMTISCANGAVISNSPVGNGTGTLPISDQIGSVAKKNNPINNAAKIIAPAAGEVWSVGKTKQIKWVLSPQLYKYVKIWLVDTVHNKESLISTGDLGTANLFQNTYWKVTGAVGKYKIKIYPIEDPKVILMSGEFNIVGPAQ